MFGVIIFGVAVFLLLILFVVPRLSAVVNFAIRFWQARLVLCLLVLSSSSASAAVDPAVDSFVGLGAAYCVGGFALGVGAWALCYASAWPIRTVTRLANESA